MGDKDPLIIYMVNALAAAEKATQAAMILTNFFRNIHAEAPKSVNTNVKTPTTRFRQGYGQII